MPAVPVDELAGRAEGESSATVRERVAAARDRQITRQGKPNAQLGPKEIDTRVDADADAETLLRQAISRLNLSARAYHRVMKVARSIADLAGSAQVTKVQVAEAIQYRRGLSN